jgi:hypothetical protein
MSGDTQLAHTCGDPANVRVRTSASVFVFLGVCQEEAESKATETCRTRGA